MSTRSIDVEREVAKARASDGVGERRAAERAGRRPAIARASVAALDFDGAVGERPEARHVVQRGDDLTRLEKSVRRCPAR